MTDLHIKKKIKKVSDYSLPGDAPELITNSDADITRYDLFGSPAPEHTKKYMVGMDVIGWTNQDGVERSQLIINQKAGSAVILWQPAEAGGIKVYLQETYRGPHPKKIGQTVYDIVQREAYGELGIWSLETPAGSLNYHNNKPAETPLEAAVREVREETGVTPDENSIVDLLPGGLAIGGDVSTKRTYLFAANIAESSYASEDREVEDDEAIGDLIEFQVSSLDDLQDLIDKTRLCAATTSGLALLSLQPSVRQRLAA